jgi:hypothetical protein
MKYARMLGLLAIAAAALMAFTGIASATQVTSPPGTAYTGVIKATAGPTSLHGPFTTVTCQESIVAGELKNHGKDITASGPITHLTFITCNFPVKVLKTGTLEIHTEYVNGQQSTTANGNGTLTSNGAEITIETSIANCIFVTKNTDIGRVTGSDTKHAVLDIESAGIPREGHSIFCGSSGTWTGSYTVTTPSTLYVD